MGKIVGQSKSTLLRDEKKYSNFPKPWRRGPKTTLYDVPKTVEFYLCLRAQEEEQTA